MRCYICNKELVENVTEANQCKSHGEHIIHNGIRGKLISNQILCENCGCDYSRDDAAFCKIFAPFIAALKIGLYLPITVETLLRRCLVAYLII